MFQLPQRGPSFGNLEKQIDAGVAGSLFRDQNRLTETICRTYPQLRKSKDGFEFGFKLAYDGLTEEQKKSMFLFQQSKRMLLMVFNNV